MDTKFTKPKSFGEILDHTFSLSKDRFKDFFLILLIFMGPVYLIEAIIQLLSGTSFFRAVGSGNGWFEQILSSFKETQTIDPNSLATELKTLVGTIIVGFIGALFFPVAKAAVLLVIQRVQKNEEYTIGLMIKQAFLRFFPILWSNILYYLIYFGLFVASIILVAFTGGIVSSKNLILGIVLAILLGLGCIVGMACLMTRWSFYFGSVVLDHQSPGFTRSWRLSRKRTWISIGLYLVFYLITICIDSAVQSTFALVLGNSVLLSIIVNIVTLLTSLFFYVGYGVIYLDLKTRHDADDLKEMIDDYDITTL
ncbi:hypothetical protein [Neobacillus massiliamazoniensis]|uniref:Glycerophosphoryl diester phosphodiesterase membrane domain-containing protein n=1 Tax=Neobacillus massiliamazoniensis TaxID=1499688 RepID=A0A0U1NYV5_9BACI|nr:hypothetical protein [Neobacillus massiliamazoniensis]CRK83196.1 hypothetical protein BN000_03156 [Neobacillus massiliamazoniensis]